jgi:hypothetical protein
MDLTSVPEISPIRFDVTDVAGFKAHLTEHGYAVVKCAAPARRLVYMILSGAVYFVNRCTACSWAARAAAAGPTPTRARPCTAALARRLSKTHVVSTYLVTPIPAGLN